MSQPSEVAGVPTTVTPFDALVTLSNQYTVDNLNPEVIASRREPLGPVKSAPKDSIPKHLQYTERIPTRYPFNAPRDLPLHDLRQITERYDGQDRPRFVKKMAGFTLQDHRYRWTMVVLRNPHTAEWETHGFVGGPNDKNKVQLLQLLFFPDTQYPSVQLKVRYKAEIADPTGKTRKIDLSEKSQEKDQKDKGKGKAKAIGEKKRENLPAGNKSPGADAVDILGIRIFANSIRRYTNDIGINMCFGEAATQGLPKGCPAPTDPELLRLATAGELMRTDMFLCGPEEVENGAKGDPVVHKQGHDFRERLTQLQNTYKAFSEKLNEGERAIAAITSTREMCLYSRWNSKQDNLALWMRFNSFFRTCMYMSAYLGNSWCYQLLYPTVSTSDSDFPIHEVEVPRWMVVKWQWYEQNNEVIGARPFQTEKFQVVEDEHVFPDNETYSFFIRLGMEREARYQEGKIDRLLNSPASVKQGTTRAYFTPNPDNAGQYVAHIYVPGLPGLLNLGVQLPRVETRCKVGVIVNQQTFWYTGNIIEEDLGFDSQLNAAIFGQPVDFGDSWHNITIE
ncbi:hypothetical protein H2203_008519 [Taxawa tesnikishii (nom. ined.)]|nr:hypothetical protein H2203_008519 [Dothideales sp. JES 119]